MANKYNIVLLFITSIAICNAAKQQSLGGTWVVTGQHEDNLVTLNDATVPGGIFSDAMNNGIIPDILYESGDTDYSWIGLTDWTYSSTFTVDEELLDNQVINLVFEGLDTFATISINGVEVGKSQNMFLRYVFEIREQLKVGDNEIEVAFTSAVNKAAELAEDPNNLYTLPPECPVSIANGICHANRIRKMQASFSWDWGPAFASVGIWKDVYLEAFNHAVIDYVVATPIKNPDKDVWTLMVTTYFNNEVDAVIGTVTATLETENEAITESFPVERTLNEYNEILITGSLEIPTDSVNTWWPNGYGTHDLYNLTVSFTPADDSDEINEITKRVGFRTIELVQEVIGQGLSFFFKINDIPIFAKGANEIPINILPEKGQDPEAIRIVLGTAKDTYMNMLRVWGGGVYESDYFYDIADEYGILIWQDFMFACALYPSSDDFLNNVAEEIKHQLKRLGTHPSIAIWAGNNENEAALRDDWWGVKANFSLYKDDYVKLYIDTIAPEVSRILPHAIFVPSSPSNGLDTVDEGYVSTNPSNPLFGDVHFYNYYADSWTPSTFPIVRFASEYGYQSYPSVESFLTAADNLEEILPSSAFMLHRQHHPDGNTENTNLISQQLQLPDTSSENYGKTVIYFSQILQAQSIRTETEYYRSFKGRLNKVEQGYTMGALYWQLNDVWVAPTWSGMDYTGRWKMLQYFTQDFFNPLIITAQLNASQYLEIYAVYDGLEVPNLKVKALLHVYKWSSLDPALAVEYPITLETEKSVLVTIVEAETAFNTAGCGTDYQTAKLNCFFHLHLMDQNNNNIAPFNYVFPSKLKYSNLVNATVEIESVIATDKENTIFEVVVTTDAVALFVWLDSHEITGRFSENGFLHILPTKTVLFMANEPTEVDNLISVLTVTHLQDPANV